MKKSLITDVHGNEIYSKASKVGEIVYLYLARLWETRRLWQLVGPKLTVRRDRDKHLYYKMNAYGFNDKLLRAISPDTTVIVVEKWRAIKLKTSVQSILTEWKYLTFSAEWFETQIFYPLSSFTHVI